MVEAASVVTFTIYFQFYSFYSKASMRKLQVRPAYIQGQFKINTEKGFFPGGQPTKPITDEEPQL